jgi:hypothetical protein
VTGEAEPTDVEIEKPHVHHHRRLGMPWYDLAIPIAALFVSFISIYIAWHHGKVMQELVHQNERLVEANSLPYLQLYGSNARKHVSFDALNEGVGPAKIITAEVLIDGRPVQTLHQLIDACCLKGDYIGLVSSSLEGRMVRAGDSVSYIDLPVTSANFAQAVTLDQARQKNRIRTRLCYCSVFDDCWMADSRDPTPDAIKQCVPPATPYRE